MQLGRATAVITGSFSVFMIISVGSGDSDCLCSLAVATGSHVSHSCNISLIHNSKIFLRKK
jgi:hypothetical protein